MGLLDIIKKYKSSIFWFFNLGLDIGITKYILDKYPSSIAMEGNLIIKYLYNYIGSDAVYITLPLSIAMYLILRSFTRVNRDFLKRALGYAHMAGWLSWVDINLAYIPLVVGFADALTTLKDKRNKNNYG